MIATSTRLAAALLALAAAGCADAVQSHQGGTYLARVVSPSGREGAAVVELEGAGIQEVSAPGSLLFRQTSGDVTRLVLVPDTTAAGGALEFRVTMADGHGAPAARVVQVAGPNDALRPAAGYTVEFRR